MKLKSIIYLLKIGELIFRKQQLLKRKFHTNDDLFSQEIQLINDVVLLDSNVIRVRRDNTYIANTDYYELLSKKFMTYYNGEIQLDEIISCIKSTRFDKFYYTGVDEALKQEQATQITNKLFELKSLLQQKRQRFLPFLSDEEKALRNEKRILQIALEEIENKRYIKKISV